MTDQVEVTAADREAAVDVCRQYEEFCGDKPLWPDEPRTSISMIYHAQIMKGLS